MLICGLAWIVLSLFGALPLYLGGSESFLDTYFETVSGYTTTGFGTTDINDPIFPPMSKQIVLVLMLIGGCVGSTGGGVKVLRIPVLFKAFRGQITKLRLPRKALSEVVVDHQIVPDAELKRIAGIFFGWLILILIGGLANMTPDKCMGCN